MAAPRRLMLGGTRCGGYFFFREYGMFTRKKSRLLQLLEGLEERALLSASHHAAVAKHVVKASSTGSAKTALVSSTSSGSTASSKANRYAGPGGVNGGTILFSQASTAIQNGLDALATTDGVTAPASTATIYLGNSNGVETYTVNVPSTGKVTKLTVDATGAAVTTPTSTSSTFGAISNSAVTNEIAAIASAIGATAPTSTSVVTVTTASSGAVTYTIALSSSTSASGWGHVTVVTVDSSGNPVGNARLPLSVFSTAIQNGLTSNAPSGSTTLTSTSPVTVQTLNGVTTYSATYTSTGTRTTVTVDATGALANLPSMTLTTFGVIPAAAQTELQTLATVDGVSGTIASTQAVSAYNEANGTMVYTVRLSATATTSSGATYTYPVTLSVDENGNPTVLPAGAFTGFGGPGRPGGFGCH
jgi:hypothetical protein